MARQKTRQPRGPDTRSAEVTAEGTKEQGCSQVQQSRSRGELNSTALGNKVGNRTCLVAEQTRNEALAGFQQAVCSTASGQ